MPRVAVIIPTYDDPRVEEAVASLAGEEKHELIIVDDGSKDPKTLAALARLEARGHRVIHQENQGLARARTTGVEATSSPYLFPLDADDQLLPGALALLADALDAASEAALAWGDIVIEPDDGPPFYRHSAPVLDPWLQLYVNAIPSSSLVRRDALLAAGGWRERVGMPDKDLWLSLLEQGRSGVYLGRPVYRYRAAESGMFQSSRSRYQTRNDATLGRHPVLVAASSENRRRSPAPWLLKLVIPLLWRLPLEEYRRSRLARAFTHLLWLGGLKEARYYFRQAR